MHPWRFERRRIGSDRGWNVVVGLGTDVDISLGGPAEHTGVIALKATHGRIPMSGLRPRVPRGFSQVGPMARFVRDVGLAYSLLRDGDGLDGYSTAPLALGAESSMISGRPSALAGGTWLRTCRYRYSRYCAGSS